MISDVAADCLEAALDGWRETGLPDPADVRVVVGDVAIEQCCDGVLVLGIEQLVWWNPFPFEALQRGGAVTIPFVGPDPCIGTFGAAATLWIGRCVPVMDERGAGPDPLAEAEAMALVVDLTQTIAETMACEAPERWAVGGADFVGTEGGCLYGRLAVRLDAR
jgi:hypothetical protein